MSIDKKVSSMLMTVQVVQIFCSEAPIEGLNGRVWGGGCPGRKSCNACEDAAIAGIQFLRPLPPDHAQSPWHRSHLNAQ